MRDSERYSKLDVGDISKNIEFKKAHNCKPFEYYLKVVAPDLEENFPAVIPTFASGIVRLLNTSQCWDTYDFQHGNGLHLYTCDNHPTYPRNTQNFQMTFYRDIENVSSQKCLDAYALQMTGCHHGFGNQYFKYDEKEKFILLGNNNQCIEADNGNNSLILKECDTNNLKQKWEWGFVNLTALANYESVARKMN
jgi:polypeptide N-acetylgalactosaminyltransferase